MINQVEREEINRFFDGFDDALRKIGIKKGDIIYVASDVRNLLVSFVIRYGEDNVDRLFELMTSHLQESVGAEGSILFPVFTWGFCSGEVFDYHKTQGEVGTYSNWILNSRPDFKRTRHPIYSFMVWGKHKDILCSMDNHDAWGIASPFFYLYKHGVKQLDINVESFRSLTFIHCFEQWVDVPYRHPKYFYGNYINESGNTEIRTYSMFVRDLEVDEHTKITHQDLVNKGVAVETQWNGNSMTMTDIQKCFDIVKDDIINNDGKYTLQFNNYVFHYGAEKTNAFEISRIPEYCIRDIIE